MAPFVVALGPGFTAGVDCHRVVETMRGHDLGRIITQGTATPNTGVPGLIEGYGRERVIHSPAAGVFQSERRIGDLVNKGDVLAHVGQTPVIATLDGVLRGLLRNGLQVSEGFKIADIDPRAEISHCLSISDKARALGGAVLEAVDSFHAGRLISFDSLGTTV
jgi:xanthine dehydrogenase accessory factor